ncbi:DUF998 domain-containing protein [Streptomyces sp. NPDC051561]|uniref:DUF998 domain-containing protein n=1 Tax=Streptomyces sp. NPDC051561 TaxID=3365658 RepID=UPI0037983462
MPSLLLACGVAAGPLFTTTYLLTGAARRNYDSLRHPVSSLALGGHLGRLQTTNFICAALLSLAFAAGLWQEGPSRWGALLIGAWGLGLLGAGLFRTDPVCGYPLGTPDQPGHPTRTGALHDASSVLAFLALTAACFVLAPSNSPALNAYSLATGALFPATMALSNVAFAPSPHLSGLGGLIQRVSLTLGWAWMTLLAVHTMNS